MAYELRLLQNCVTVWQDHTVKGMQTGHTGVFIQTRVYSRSQMRENSVLLYSCSSKSFYIVQRINQQQLSTVTSQQVKNYSHYDYLNIGQILFFQAIKRQFHHIQWQTNLPNSAGFCGQAGHLGRYYQGHLLLQAVSFKSSKIRPYQHAQNRPHLSD